jgi:hypothetical protein
MLTAERINFVFAQIRGLRYSRISLQAKPSFRAELAEMLGKLESLALVV